MPTIIFKAKAHPGQSAHTLEWSEFVQVPKLQTKHCDMPAFRKSLRFGGYANSDLFTNMLRRELVKEGISSRIDINNPPRGVTVDTSGFLARVTIEID